MRDVLIGCAVVLAMSAAYLQGGIYQLRLPGLDRTTVVPVVSCVAPDPSVPGGFIASFGYERTGGAPVFHRPASTGPQAFNAVDIDGQPLAPSGDLPVDFLIGSHPHQFMIRARAPQQITWRVTAGETRTAVATARTQPPCPLVPVGGQ